MFETVYKEQEDIVKSLEPKCKNICSYMYPIDEDKSDECVLNCSEQNRSLFRMENISNIVLIIAFLFLGVSIFIHLR